MRSNIKKVLAVVAIAALVYGGAQLLSSPDPGYTLENWIALGRFDSIDAEIRERATAAGVDPLLAKALAWRASRVRPDFIGAEGRRGVLAVRPDAAVAWVSANRIETFMITDLFDPGTNMMAGLWNLKAALKRFEKTEDAMQCALIAHFADPQSMDRWWPHKQAPERASDLLQKVDRPDVRQAVEDTMRRWRTYKSAAHGSGPL